jgi:hypothetical protein
LSPAYCAEWIFITKHENGSTVYYDKDTVKNLSEKRLRVWVKFEYREYEAKQVQNKMKLEKEPDHLLVEYGINCTAEKSKALSSFYYSKSGDVLGNFDFSDSDDWDSIAPETVMDSLYRLICLNSIRVE